MYVLVLLALLLAPVGYAGPKVPPKPIKSAKVVKAEKKAKPKAKVAAKAPAKKAKKIAQAPKKPAAKSSVSKKRPLSIPEILLAEEQESAKANKPKTAKEVLPALPVESKPFRIVLDPGHGGDDPGAIGKSGLREKDITLAVSKRVKALIEEKLPGSEVLLTRDTDKTLSLPSRTDFANRVKADLFVSIHVNASPNRDTAGIETYYLNITHDRYALRLAARENAMSETETSNLEYILADLAMKSSVTDSVKLGRLVQASMCGHMGTDWDDIRDLGLKSAMFYVLMGAKMPAILVETAFISNKTEEKRLKQDKYQDALAEGIVKGIKRYSEEQVVAVK